MQTEPAEKQDPNATTTGTSSANRASERDQSLLINHRPTPPDEDRRQGPEGRGSSERQRIADDLRLAEMNLLDALWCTTATRSVTALHNRMYSAYQAVAQARALL